jgi:flagellar hook-associated protein 2
VGISLAGLSSGLDTNSLIDGLMQVEQAPRANLVLRQSAAQARQDGLNAIKTKLTALTSAASALSSVLTWGATQTASSTDSTVGTARITGGAGPGSYDVVVTQLATAEQRTYSINDSFQSRTVTLNGQNFTINRNETVDSIVSRLNGDTTYGVYAVNSGGNLVLSGRQTGVGISLTNGGSVVTEQTSAQRLAKQATYAIDGVTYTSSSNTISSSSTTNPTNGFIGGVEFTLKGPGSFTVDVSPPGVDKASVTQKVKDFVNAYNAALDLMQKSVTEKKVPTASTDSDAKKGALWSDNTVEGMMSAMRMSVTTFMDTDPNKTTLYDEMAELGISTGAATGTGTFSQDSVNGKLVFDEAKFSAALDADPTAVQRMLAGVNGGTGFAQAFSTAVSPYTVAGGLFDNSIDAATRMVQDYTDSIARMDDRLAMKKEQLQKMFTNLETSLQKTKSQGTELLAKLGVQSSDS